MSHNAFWGRSAGQVNVTRAGFAVSYFVSHTCWQPLPQRVISVNANDSTAAGIKRLRRLKFKRCGELASRLSSRLTFACVCLVVRANHLTVYMPLRIRVGVHRVFPQTAKPPGLHTVRKVDTAQFDGPPATLSQRQHRPMPYFHRPFSSHNQRITRLPHAILERASCNALSGAALADGVHYVQPPPPRTLHASHPHPLHKHAPYAVKNTITPLTPMYEYTIYFNAAEGICR